MDASEPALADVKLRATGLRYRFRMNGRAIALAGVIAIGAFGIGRGTAPINAETNAVPDQSVFYARCADARASGAAPIYEGQPGYRDGLDRDGDGIACEAF